MTDLTKLADALESYTGDGHGYQVDDAVLREAARILRSAAGVDVDKLMAQIRFAIADASMGGEPDTSAIESALRLALAAREGFVMVPVEPTPDMLEAGAGTKYEKRARNVWRDMIAAAAPKGTT